MCKSLSWSCSHPHHRKLWPDKGTEKQWMPTHTHTHTTQLLPPVLSTEGPKIGNKYILVTLSHVEVMYLLLIGRAQAAVQLSTLFPSIPDGEALPLAKYSLLQEVHSQLPNGFPEKSWGDDQMKQHKYTARWLDQLKNQLLVYFLLMKLWTPPEHSVLPLTEV